MDCNRLQSVSSVVVDKNSKRLYYTRKEKVIYDVRCRDEDVFFFSYHSLSQGGHGLAS